jgi:putative intracellular protease/amidase
MRIPMVITSHDRWGNPGRKTGFWLEEFAAPSFVFRDAGEEARQQLSQTVQLSDRKAEEFDTIFYVGGDGPMWDRVDNLDAMALIESFYNSGRPVAAVRHSAAVFHHGVYQGEPFVKGIYEKPLRPGRPNG